MNELEKQEMVSLVRELSIQLQAQNLVLSAFFQALAQEQSEMYDHVAEVIEGMKKIQTTNSLHGPSVLEAEAIIGKGRRQ